MPPSRPFSISNTLENLHWNTHMEEPLAHHILPSPTNETKAIFGCMAAEKNPPKTSECRASLLLI